MNKGRREIVIPFKMSGIKVDLMWSPHNENKFITIGSEVQLYEVHELKEDVSVMPEAIQVSDSQYACLLETSSDHQYVRCVAWYPKPQYEHLLAIGLANGKVALTNFDERNDFLSEFPVKEFVPKHSRSCNCLSWNTTDCKLLACGMEKNRVDHGVVIWDVTRPKYTTPETISSFEKRQAQSTMFHLDAPPVSRPAFELGPTESCQSLQWFSQSGQLLVCGMNNKHIKIYDIRADPIKPQNSTPTKSVYDVCIDPWSEHRLASVFENLFVLWDIRNFEKPILTTHEQRQILKISWSPTRSNVLGALIKDSNAIKLYNIRSLAGNDEIEPTIVERTVQPFANVGVMSFAWHPTQENRLMTISSNSMLADYTMFDRITLNWAPTSELVWICGKKMLQFIGSTDDFFEHINDIAIKMRQRACNGYGLDMQKVCNNAILGGDPALLGVWVWLELMKNQPEDKKSKINRSPNKHQGVHTIMCGEGRKSILTNSQMVHMSWNGLNTVESKVTKYTSPEREKALYLCGWGSEMESTVFLGFLERLENEKMYTRAAAISVFMLNIRTAIQILNRGAESSSGDLNAVAMALAGYTDDESALWHEISSGLKSKLSDPYLRATFAFLTTSGNNLDEILNEPGITVQDRLVVALLYLPDQKLVEYLDQLKVQMVETGNLDGMLLTGLTDDGLDLIQCYVDITADVQTASLILLHTLPTPLSKDSRIKSWVQSYRHLLDTWRMWKQRAMFDVQWYKGNPAEGKPMQQIFVSCTFCGKSVSNYLSMAAFPSSGSRSSQLVNPAQKCRVTACPSCRKPLPRCSLCLCHMGTPAGFCWRRPNEKKKEKKLSIFSNWLTWCQTCRHGGHCSHILSWFNEHTECSVTGCTCKCMSLDSVSKLVSVLDNSS